MNIEEALDYICEHQFELDAKMRKAVYAVMNDRNNKQAQLLELIDYLEREISRNEAITQMVVDIGKRLDMEVKLTKDQLRILQTQKNTKGLYSQNANRAQKILWQTNGHTTMSTGRDGLPLNMHEKGWEVPTEETVDLEPWLNGTEV